MEFFTILLSSLLGIISPVGVVVDKVAADTLRKQFAAVEQLQVRIDNAPSYQLVRGKVDRVRIAGRGLFPIQGFRLEALELETDPIHFDGVRRGKIKLIEPLRAGVHFVVKEADIQRALRSPAVVAKLRELGLSALRPADARQAKRYEILNPQVDFLDHQRLRVQVDLREKGDPAVLQIFVETGIDVVTGQSFRLVQPVIKLNGEAVPNEVVNSISNGVAEQSDLNQLAKSGIVARILQLKLDPDQLDLAAFIQVENIRR